MNKKFFLKLVLISALQLFGVSSAFAKPPPAPLPEPEDISVLTADQDTLLITAISILDRSNDYHRYHQFKRIHEFALKNGVPSKPLAKALNLSLERRFADEKKNNRDPDHLFLLDLRYAADFLEIGETVRGTELLELHCRLEADEFDAAIEIFETMANKNDGGHLCALVEGYLIKAEEYEKLREFAVLSGKYPGRNDGAEWYMKNRLNSACYALVHANKDAEAEKLAAEFGLTPKELFYAKWERSKKARNVEEMVRLLNELPDEIGKAY